jgi:L-ribulose-5-phosphate 4-epimerase
MGAYDELREEAFLANLEVDKLKLAILTWGNASAFDPSLGFSRQSPRGWNMGSSARTSEASL